MLDSPARPDRRTADLRRWRESHARQRAGDYSPAQVAVILDEIAAEMLVSGYSLAQACRREDLPSHDVVLIWAREDPAVRARLDAAEEARLDRLADEMLEISDDSTRDTLVDDDDGHEVVDRDHIARSRLRVETRRWMLERLARRKYGVNVEVTGAGGGPVTPPTLVVNFTTPGPSAVDVPDIAALPRAAAEAALCAVAGDLRRMIETTPR